MDARLIDPLERQLVPARAQLDALLTSCRAHAAALGCDVELDQVRRVATNNGAVRHRAWVRVGGLLELVQTLSELFPRHARDRDMPLLTTAANEDRPR